jgi:hypothetical protein
MFLSVQRACLPVTEHSAQLMSHSGGGRPYIHHCAIQPPHVGVRNKGLTFRVRRMDGRPTLFSLGVYFTLAGYATLRAAGVLRSWMVVLCDPIVQNSGELRADSTRFATPAE